MAKKWAQKFYLSKAWKQCREGYILSVNGLCERCLSRQKMRPGKILHHIKYLTPTNINDPYVTLNWENLEYLCQDCHNEEHHGAYEATREDVQFDQYGNLILKE